MPWLGTIAGFKAQQEEVIKLSDYLSLDDDENMQEDIN